MRLYDMELTVSPDGFSYATIGYRFFELREVLKDKEPTGEYHVKLLDLSDPKNAIGRFRKILPSCIVGLVDPEGILKLEYPIYIIIKDRMVKDNLNEIMSDLDEQLYGEVHYAQKR